MSTSMCCSADHETPSNDGSRRLRIVHIVDYLMPGMGYQEFLLPKWNAKHGHEVHIVTCNRYRPVPNYEQTWGPMLGPRIREIGTEELDGLAIHRLPTRWECRARPWMSGMIRRVRRLRPDVVYCHGTTSFSAIRLACMSERVACPVFMDCHMVYGSRNTTPMARVYYKLLLLISQTVLAPNVTRFFGVAEECCDFLRKEQGVPAGRLELLPLGVDTDVFRPAPAHREQMRGELGIPYGAKVILQTGKLVPAKSPHWLSEAAARIMADDPHVWLIYVGGGPSDYVESLRRPLSMMGVADRLRIFPPSPMERLAGLFRISDVVVYPNATSLSCLEAAACGCVVVMSDWPTSRWRAQRGVGMCYPTGDVEALRHTISDLLVDPAALREMGLRAADAVRQHFSYDAIATQMENRVLEAIADRSRRDEPTRATATSVL